jgi:HD-GYP domain-containing protein (c-di-GMP phosphodiesterase class II)
MAGSAVLRVVQQEQLSLAELLASLSHALDMTEGQPEGHCIRVCWIGMHIGREIGLPEAELWELYYTLLLKDLGCSSNAARICELYLADDHAIKREFKRLDRGVAPALSFVLKHTGLKAGLAERFRAIAGILKNGGDVVQELIETRCTRGAEIARKLRFSDAVANGIHDLDEHWDGAGRPAGLQGAEISLYARIALLAQVVDVFQTAEGPHAAIAEVGRRAGTWFDPALVMAFQRLAARERFWEALADPDLAQRVFGLEPARHMAPLDEDWLDDIAEAYGQVVDAKSPYTAGHSARVALYVDLIAEKLAFSAERRRWLKRGALLHDVGKLGVSNAILDKPGKLDEAEWAQMRAHAAYTHAILSRISAFDELARISAAHHERLDGAGYPYGLAGREIPLETRIISVADFFDAITADRPYREAMPLEQALGIMRGSVGSAIDGEVLTTLEAVIADLPQLPG